MRLKNWPGLSGESRTVWPLKGKKIRKEDDVKRIVIDKASHEQGRSDGKSGRESTVPPGVDSFSYYSGYIEGKAVRERTKCHRFVPEDPGKERG